MVDNSSRPCFATGHGIICAGLPRSGTLSLATALEILGVGPVHHLMYDRTSRQSAAWAHAAWCSFPSLCQTRLPAPPGCPRLPWYLPPYDPLLPWTRTDWDRLLGCYRCTTDIASFFSEQLIGVYPEARVILVERPVDRWARSFDRILIKAIFSGFGGFLLCTVGPWVNSYSTVMTSDVVMGWTGAGTWREARERLHLRHREHYAMVRRLVPPEQLLEFDYKDGWEPLCKFLDVPVPDVPFPHANEETEIMQLIELYKKKILFRFGKRVALAMLVVGAAQLLTYFSGAARAVAGWLGLSRLD